MWSIISFYPEYTHRGFREDVCKQLFVTLNRLSWSRPQSRTAHTHTPTCWEDLSGNDTHFLLNSHINYIFKGSNPLANTVNEKNNPSTCTARAMKKQNYAHLWKLMQITRHIGLLKQYITKESVHLLPKLNIHTFQGILVATDKDHRFPLLFFLFTT